MLVVYLYKFYMKLFNNFMYLRCLENLVLTCYIFSVHSCVICMNPNFSIHSCVNCMNSIDLAL